MGCRPRTYTRDSSTFYFSVIGWGVAGAGYCGVRGLVSMKWILAGDESEICS